LEKLGLEKEERKFFIIHFNSTFENGECEIQEKGKNSKYVKVLNIFDFGKNQNLLSDG